MMPLGSPWMILSILTAICFVAGVILVARWAARRPTERPTIIEQLTRAPDQDAQQDNPSHSGS